MVFGVVGIFLASIVVNTAWADIQEIQILSSFGLSGSFDATSGDLDKWGVNGAVVVTDEGPEFFPASDINFNFVLPETGDLSGGGVAKGYTETGTWSAKVFKPTYSANPVLEIGGDLVWFMEEEDPAQTLRGMGILYLTTETVDAGYFGAAAEWADTNGYSALRTTSTVISLNPLLDYTADFTCGSVTTTIYADSGEVPEPVSMLLLGLGSVAVLRRKRK